MCLAAPQTFHQFLVVRLFLGIAEGAVSPAFITITSIWYKKSEHPLRIAYVNQLPYHYHKVLIGVAAGSLAMG